MLRGPCLWIKFSETAKQYSGHSAPGRVEMWSAWQGVGCVCWGVTVFCRCCSETVSGAGPPNALVELDLRGCWQGSCVPPAVPDWEAGLLSLCFCACGHFNVLLGSLAWDTACCLRGLLGNQQRPVSSLGTRPQPASPGPSPCVSP